MADGGHFVGDFNAEFKPHGEGTRYRADGSELFSGQWRDGKMHGRGKLLYSSGDCYEGDFVAGQMSGLGMFTWGDGRVFEGEWAGVQMSGFGMQWSQNGTLLHCGRWAENLIDTRPVPRVKILVGKFLSAAGRHHSRADS